MNRFEISDPEYEAIQAAYAETREKNTRRRLRVLMMRHEGYSATDTAKIVGINRSTVYLLYNRYQALGMAQFMQGGHIRKTQRPLTDAQEDALMETFAKQAEEGRHVTAQEIKQAVEDMLGRSVGMRYVLMLLGQYGWRKAKLRLDDGEGEKKRRTVCWIPETMCHRTPSKDRR